MKVPFSKYQGTGNDFIIIDNRLLQWSPAGAQIALLCDRHFGIGADGLMLLSNSPGYDFKMTYFNSDGNESTMCGNGGRCITAFAGSLGIIGNTTRFLAADGVHEAEIKPVPPAKIYRLRMQDCNIGIVYDDGVFIDTGSPHFTVFVDDCKETNVLHEGRQLRYDERFASGGTNVDFIEIRETGLFVRSYERGVENETLSCGTGVTAASLVTAFRNPGNPGYYTVATPGGNLRVSFRQESDRFYDVWLEGPAEMAFEGEAEVSEW